METESQVSRTATNHRCESQLQNITEFVGLYIRRPGYKHHQNELSCANQKDHNMDSQVRIANRFYSNLQMPVLEAKLAVRAMALMLTNVVYFNLLFCFALAKNFDKSLRM